MFEKSTQKRPSRRRVLRDLLGVSGMLAADVLAGGSRAASAPRRAVRLLHLAATTEALSVSFYTAVLTGATFQISASGAATLQQVQEAATQHLREVLRLGGVPSASTFYVSTQVLTDARQFVSTAQHLSQLNMQTYLSATEAFAAQAEPMLAATAARLAASEAQHAVKLAHVSGLGTGLISLGALTTQQLKCLLAELAPYLQPHTQPSASLRLTLGAG